MATFVSALARLCLPVPAFPLLCEYGRNLIRHCHTRTPRLLQVAICVSRRDTYAVAGWYGKEVTMPARGWMVRKTSYLESAAVGEAF
jgi:hypothetical protein